MPNTASFLVIARPAIAGLAAGARQLAAVIAIWAADDGGESWADLVAQYQAAEDEIAQWQAVYDELRAEAEAIDARRDELRTEIGEYRTRIGLIDNDIEALNGVIADLQDHIADLETQRIALADESASLASGDALDEVMLNKELQQQLIDERDAAQAELNRRRADLIDLNSQRQGLEDFIGSADDEFQSLKPDLEDAWSSVGDAYRILQSKTAEMNRLDAGLWDQI